MSQYNPRELADLVYRPIVTEKATLLMEQNKYVFEVVPKATKPEIKAAIEDLFKVKVVSVNTLRLPRKKRRVGKFAGFKPQYKRAIVTLASGETITLFPEV
ncbi:50S ribosomal protein L23 [Coleofasciculus sp. FACHB-64]|uniref:50S ribosomal protein L23 n=1 Tax=Cyanophyceae TaxID=3028117 RepID=UPI001685993C|nr:50S ribosomal protein L23 [Coleofasciculus sp. FACHB-501]MBD1881631.1 50S ribosomal protein L23 [Coleofasciculus sp. FACHB-T130]MBD1889060.1 50S ribosomal protein L23 [Coleofasciculus sp. FACHB-SPT9]MBD1895421.1 50S ribosomal protein L23 [Coleofasciculus sp. FACHB-129]MBD1900287.1 50S ribosomal protein L23 [Coleofasciculus sp. FACHB-125]MBD1941083.1 50S ribosomal protein L23 [Coleofasciculus sp. FACHB-712]MBD2044305.1 50S ribosomal protein L23 [Coleofasciculus sp. FACHB-64]MBD2087856.1 50